MTKYTHEWYERNKESLNRAKKKWREKNKERLKAYYQAHKAEFKARFIKWQEKQERIK